MASSTTWQRRWADMLRLTASWSEDVSSQYAALIVDPRNVLISLGYNGIPRGIKLREEYHLRPDKYDYFIHAEINCLLQTTSNITKCTLYLIRPPCAQCAGAIIQSGLKDIRYIEDHDINDPRFLEESTGWRESVSTAYSMLMEAGVYIEKVRGQ